MRTPGQAPTTHRPFTLLSLLTGLLAAACAQTPMEWTPTTTPQTPYAQDVSVDGARAHWRLNGDAPGALRAPGFLSCS